MSNINKNTVQNKLNNFNITSIENDININNKKLIIEILKINQKKNYDNNKNKIQANNIENTGQFWA